MHITDDERKVLLAFADNIIGGPEERCGLVEELQPALASLKSKGLVIQVWMLSPEAAAILED